jgi:hypothetical protein
MTITHLDGRPRRRSRLFIATAIGLPTIVLAGFARTYYLKGLFQTPPLASALVHLHGILMTAWVALFVFQVALVERRRIRVHQRLGVIGALLAVTMVPVGLAVAVGAARRGGGPPGVPPLVFMVVPMMDMAVFMILVGTAFAYRRRPEIHRRLMALTAFNFLPPALARIALVVVPSAVLPAAFGIGFGLLLLAVTYDTWRHRRLHPAMALGALLILLSLPLRMAIGGTDWWMRFASWLVGTA